MSKTGQEYFTSPSKINWSIKRLRRIGTLRIQSCRQHRGEVLQLTRKRDYMMPYFDSGSVRLHYLDCGMGPAVVLIHSMASTLQHSWVDTGWVEELRSNYRVVAMDCRGHGMSAKSDDPDFYTADKMADDVVRLIDQLQIGRTLVAGYSMGACVALNMAVRYGDRVRAMVIGGVSSRAYKEPPREDLERMVEVLRADDATLFTDKAALFMRSFCLKNGNDPKALAAFSLHRRPDVEQHQLASIRGPVLIAAGTRDAVVQGVDELAASIPDARVITLEGRTHIDALSDPRFKGAAAEFFAASPQ
jgi:pimeloyl-ACP methyl ester carboxylesterase